MNRLVTKEDILANPELSKKGVSVNQRYNFPDDKPVSKPKEGYKKLFPTTKPDKGKK